MDETDAPGWGATQLVCLKVSRAGGIGSLLAKAAFCQAVGEEVYLASTLDGPLGIAAAVHCAAALRIARPCGLATLDRLDGVDPGPLAPVGGLVEAPRSPGLGATPEHLLR
jgi:L-alanine-DL-glutamate epimerase-like enolase superfamily enzyme